MLEAAEILGLLPRFLTTIKKSFIVQDIINIRNSIIHLFFPLTFFNSLNRYVQKIPKIYSEKFPSFYSCLATKISSPKAPILSISYLSRYFICTHTPFSLYKLVISSFDPHHTHFIT